MRLSAKSKAIGLIALSLGLSACADYMNHWDTITLGAGNAREANTAIQGVDPFPPNAGDTTIIVSGKQL